MCKKYSYKSSATMKEDPSDQSRKKRTKTQNRENENEPQKPGRRQEEMPHPIGRASRTRQIEAEWRQLESDGEAERRCPKAENEGNNKNKANKNNTKITKNNNKINDREEIKPEIRWPRRPERARAGESRGGRRAVSKER